VAFDECDSSSGTSRPESGVDASHPGPDHRQVIVLVHISPFVLMPYDGDPTPLGAPESPVSSSRHSGSPSTPDRFNQLEVIEMKLNDCVPRTDWIFLGLGSLLMVVGASLTLTWIGAIIGIPIFLAALELITKPKTVRSTHCA
jgi:hypothetical protein